MLPSAVRKCGAVLMRVYRIQQAQLGILVQLWDKVDADRVATLAAAKRAHDLAAAEAADAEARAAEAEAKKRVRHRAPSKHKKDNKAVVVKSAVSQVKSLEWYKEQVERVPMYVIAVATDGCQSWLEVAPVGVEGMCGSLVAALAGGGATAYCHYSYYRRGDGVGGGGRRHRRCRCRNVLLSVDLQGNQSSGVGL